MLPTPSTSHLDFSNIYPPSEDSYLLLDTLSHTSQTAYLTNRFPIGTATPVVIEVGPGSGVVLAFVAANASIFFGRADVLVCGVDVNEFACKGTATTVKVAVDETSPESALPAGIWLDCMRGDLVGCLRQGVVDMLIFNPPYVPSETVPELTNVEEDDGTKTDHFARDSKLLALATDGGEEGMEVTYKLLLQLDGALSSRGLAYILLCAQNKPEKVKESIRQWGDGWTVDTVHTSGKQGGWEKLQIVRIARRIQD